MSEEVVPNGPAEVSGDAEATKITPITFAGDSGGGESGESQGDWREMLPEEYREASWATKYESPDELFKGIDNMAKLVGKKSEGVTIPGEDATVEEWESFYKGIGRPDSPNEYKITLPQENAKYFQEGDIESITEMFHKSGLNSKQAQALTEQYLQWQTGKMSALSEAVQAERVDAEKALRSEWGNNYDANVKAAYRGAEAAGVVEELEKAGLGDNPAILKLAELAGRSIKEDHQRDGSQFSRQISRAEAERELTQITTDPNFRRDPVKSARVSQLMDVIGVNGDSENGASFTFSGF